MLAQQFLINKARFVCHSHSTGAIAMSVWQRQRNWWSEVLWKPKKQLSIDQLK